MTDLTGVPHEGAVISSHRDVPGQFKRLESCVRGWVGFEELQMGGGGGEGRVFLTEHKQVLGCVREHGGCTEGCERRGGCREGARDRNEREAASWMGDLDPATY